MTLNPLQIDPTRTTTIRRAFAVEMAKRLRAFYDDVVAVIKVEFEPPFQVFNADGDAAKLERIRDKVQQSADNRLNGLDPHTSQPWADKYITGAYRKGAQQSYHDLNKADASAITHEVGKASEVNAVETSVAGRSTLLKLFTKVKEIIKAAAQGLVGAVVRVIGKIIGREPEVKEVVKEVKEEAMKTDGNLKVTVENEVSESFAEGQLDMLERQGVLELELEDEVDFTTAGDKKVCKRCRALARKSPYTITQARGIIPVHPRCRCKWKPRPRVDQPMSPLAKNIQLFLPGLGAALPRTV